MTSDFITACFAADFSIYDYLVINVECGVWILVDPLSVFVSFDSIVMSSSVRHI